MFFTRDSMPKLWLGTLSLGGTAWDSCLMQINSSCFAIWSMWNLSAPFDTSESGYDEKWRTVLRSHPMPWRRELGQPCLCWSYMNAHQCPQLLGIQSSTTSLPSCQTCRKLHSPAQVPGTGNLVLAVPRELKSCFPLRQQQPLGRDTCFHTIWKRVWLCWFFQLSLLEFHYEGRALSPSH